MSNNTKPTIRSWSDMIADNLPEHSEYLGRDLKQSLERCRGSFSPRVVDACAMVSAICANNGELAFEIGMSSELIGTDAREHAKNAAVVASRVSIGNKILHAASHVILTSAISDNVLKNNSDYMIYLLAGAITLGDTVAVDTLKTHVSIKELSAMIDLCSIVSSIGRIAH